MEKKIQIETEDNHIIYGTFNSIKKSKKIVIFVHGLTGNQNEHMHFNGSKFLKDKGFDTFRFDLYCSAKKGRNLIDTTISIHSQDLNLVISNFEKDYEKIYLIGHSLAGPVIGSSNLSKVNAVCLWDPSIRIDTFEKRIGHKRIENTSLFILWDICIINQSIIDDWNSFDNEKYVKSLIKPTKLIVAKIDCWNHEYWPKFLNLIPSEHSYVEFENSSHGFEEEGEDEKLFQETLNWFNKF